MMAYPQLQFESTFMEEAVFLSMRVMDEKASIVKSFHRKREALYKNALNPEEREAAFLKLYRDFFKELGFEKFFQEALGEFPLLSDPNVFVIVKRAWSKKEEDTELYVRGALKTIGISLQVIRLLQLESLKIFLRHELLRISDMLDPEFKYSRDADLGGENEVENNLIRDRFRLLWDLYINARLRRKGLLTTASLEQEKTDFQRSFPACDQCKKDEVFQRMMRDEFFDQHELLSLAGGELLPKAQMSL